jgi:hypothetical protein
MDWGTVGGWAGGLAGCAIGLLGAVIGTYVPIRNAKGQRERAYLIKASIICWIFVGLFLAGMFLVPRGYNFFLMIPYVVVLLWGIGRGMRHSPEFGKRNRGPTPEHRSN